MSENGKRRIDDPPPLKKAQDTDMREFDEQRTYLECEMGQSIIITDRHSPRGYRISPKVNLGSDTVRITISLLEDDDFVSGKTEDLQLYKNYKLGGTDILFRGGRLPMSNWLYFYIMIPFGFGLTSTQPKPLP